MIHFYERALLGDSRMRHRFNIASSRSLAVANIWKPTAAMSTISSATYGTRGGHSNRLLECLQNVNILLGVLYNGYRMFEAIGRSSIVWRAMGCFRPLQSRAIWGGGQSIQEEGRSQV